MKKLSLLAISLMSISLLASCENGSKDTPIEPTYTVYIKHNECCSVSTDTLTGVTGSIQTFTITPNDDYTFNENGLGFVDDQDELIENYDGNFSYDNNTKTVSVTIGSSDIKLMCYAYKAYQVGISLVNCTSNISLIEGPSGYSKTFYISPYEGHIFNSNSFTWVDQKGDSIDDYNGNYYYEELNNRITVYIGDGNAIFKCTAFKLHTITISATNCVTVGKTEIVDINNAKVAFDLIPNKEEGYILEDDCFSWVDSKGDVIDNYDGDYEYNDEAGTITITVGNMNNVTLKCDAKPRTSTIKIQTIGNCSTMTESISGIMEETRTFELNVSPGNSVSYAFAPDNTGASVYEVGNMITVKIGNNDAVLACSTTSIEYTITISAGEHIKFDYSAYKGTTNKVIEIPYAADDGWGFSGGITFSPADTGASVEFKDENKIKITFGVGNTNINIVTAERWCYYHDWWDHCSNGDSNVQANENDIGRIVPLKLKNGITHQVRLIDVDHDYLASDNSKYAHCTFEFANVITQYNGAAYSCNYRIFTDSGYDFPGICLNKNLQEGGAIYNLFDSSLTNKMVNITKWVAHLTHSFWSGDYWENMSYTTKLFPLSYHEVVNEDHKDHVQDREGYIYTYYKYASDADRIKNTALVNGSSNKNGYWLRSPAVSTELGFAWNVSQDGSTSYVLHKNWNSVAPAFCI